MNPPLDIQQASDSRVKWGWTQGCCRTALSAVVSERDIDLFGMTSSQIVNALVPTTFWAVCLLINPAHAAPIRTRPNLVSVTFYEQTDRLFAHTFAANDPELITRLTDPLSASKSDFLGTPVEFYDVYYSDSDGAFNLDGAFISVTAAFNVGLPAGGGLNLAEVALNFTSGPSVRPTTVSSFVALGNNAIPGDVNNAVDGDLNTWTTMGNTIGTDLRLRVTVGEFTAVPEPSTGIFVTFGLITVLLVAPRLEFHR